MTHLGTPAGASPPPCMSMKGRGSCSKPHPCLLSPKQRGRMDLSYIGQALWGRSSTRLMLSQVLTTIIAI